MQIDLEMAFSDGERVMTRVEKFIQALFLSLQDDARRYELSMMPSPVSKFPRMTYHEVMGKYGTDKPDLRIPDMVSNS